jgi:hypothetical protein
MGYSNVHLGHVLYHIPMIAKAKDRIRWRAGSPAVLEVKLLMPGIHVDYLFFNGMMQPHPLPVRPVKASLGAYWWMRCVFCVSMQ